MDLNNSAKRRAAFREIARAIVRTDRERRKFGLTVDTGGVVARALEKAFQAGVGMKHAQLHRGSTDTRPTEWLEIPPRPRVALWSICLWSLGTETPSRPEVVAHFVLRNHRWVLQVDGQEISETSTYGDRTVKPLLRLGLLTATGPNLDSLRLTNLARRIWREAVAANPMLAP